MSSHLLRTDVVMGQNIEKYLNDLAKLRIEVFKDYPYLYDGNLDYESNYLAKYCKDRKSIAVIVKDGDRIVGASTAMPLSSEHEEFKLPFKNSGIDINDVYYLAESVLLPEYRGRGLGHRFFDFRESHASALRFSITAFCAVERPTDHPSAPADYSPLDEFWKSRGYRKSPLTSEFKWKEIGESEESPKTMRFWLKSTNKDF